MESQNLNFMPIFISTITGLLILLVGVCTWIIRKLVKDVESVRSGGCELCKQHIAFHKGAESKE